MGRKVIIIGGGASGLVCGILTAREGARVIILEHTGKIGKKLLSTGNGKCNLTNLAAPKGAYRSDNPEFVKSALSQFTVKDTLEFFKGLGLLFSERDGYVYPRSGQASSVLEVLEEENRRLGAEIICGCRVEEIVPGTPFLLRTSAGEFQADAVVLAAGSKAAPATGSDGSGYELAGRLGHKVITPLPALVQLRCRETYWKQASGVRTEASAALLADGKEKARDRGELQITDYGISGIPVFQISRYASKALAQGKRVTVKIDFMPSMSREELIGFLEERKARLGHWRTERFLTGVLNGKLSAMLLSLSKIRSGGMSRDLTAGQLKCLAGVIKGLETEITATNPYENAQVCCGGVDTRAVRPDTMESRLVPGLFFAGEILDVDGICGGYNLQWAWSSGAAAGRAAALGSRTEKGGGKSGEQYDKD